MCAARSLKKWLSSSKKVDGRSAFAAQLRRTGSWFGFRRWPPYGGFSMLDDFQELRGLKLS
jgi:hypothetical protein